MTHSRALDLKSGETSTLLNDWCETEDSGATLQSALVVTEQGFAEAGFVSALSDPDDPTSVQ